MDAGEILLYEAKDGNIKIDVRLEGDTVWLSQEQMSLLFGKSRSTITEHIGNIFKEEELDQEVVCREFRHTTQHGASLRMLGMQSFDKKNSTGIKKSDVSIAKNYLTEDEIKLLGLLVEQYLAFAETMAQQHTPMYMKDWIQRLDSILQMNGRELLTHAGKISHELALKKSEEEYGKFQLTQKQNEKEQSLKEIEADIKKLKTPKK